MKVIEMNGQFAANKQETKSQMSEKSFIQKRKYYRLKYPHKARPVMRIKDELFHVSEVSERVFALWCNIIPVYRGFSMAGTLRLHGNKQCHY